MGVDPNPILESAEGEHSHRSLRRSEAQGRINRCTAKLQSLLSNVAAYMDDMDPAESPPDFQELSARVDDLQDSITQWQMQRDNWFDSDREVREIEDGVRVLQQMTLSYNKHASPSAQ